MNGEIYRIWFSNDDQQRSYIGQTRAKGGAKARVAQHIYDAIKQDKRHRTCPLLSKAIREFGTDNLCWEVIESGIMTQEELDAAEKRYIQQFHSKRPTGFNIDTGGVGPGKYYTAPHTMKNNVHAEIAETERVYLNVPFRSKATAKICGCLFDPKKKLWYTVITNRHIVRLILFYGVNEDNTSEKIKQIIEDMELSWQNAR